MKTIEVKLYSIEELSPTAQSKAHNKWLQGFEYFWSDENVKTLKKFCEVFNLNLKDYCYGDRGEGVNWSDNLDSNGDPPKNEGENLVRIAQEGYRKDIEQVKQEMEEYLGEELTPVYNLENIINATWQQIDNKSLTLKL